MKKNIEIIIKNKEGFIQTTNYNPKKDIIFFMIPAHTEQKDINKFMEDISLKPGRILCFTDDIKLVILRNNSGV